MQAVHPLTFSDAYSLNPNPPPTGEVNPNPPSTGGVRGGHSVGAFFADNHFTFYYHTSVIPGSLPLHPLSVGALPAVVSPEPEFGAFANLGF